MIIILQTGRDAIAEDCLDDVRDCTGLDLFGTFDSDLSFEVRCGNEAEKGFG